MSESNIKGHPEHRFNVLIKHMVDRCFNTPEADDSRAAVTRNVL